MSDVIVVDHSIISTFSTCNEKGRLSYVEHLKPIGESAPLVFGSAFHAAIADLYSGGNVESAKLSFVKEARTAPGALPLEADTGERRSYERAMYLIEAYAEKWKSQDILWKDLYQPDSGLPYVEVGFAVYFMDWNGRPVLYVGKIDRIRKNRVDNGVYNWETKTTSSNVGHYVQQVRPNHQITGYKWAARELLNVEITGTILDIVHVSDRKIGGKFPNGIDLEKDFGRVETRRSNTDVDEFLYDLRLSTSHFLSLQDNKSLKRWHRNAPSACYMYGGCHFRDICASNLNPSIVNSKYKIERWEPWTINEHTVTNSPANILPDVPLTSTVETEK